MIFELKKYFDWTLGVFYNIEKKEKYNDNKNYSMNL